MHWPHTGDTPPYSLLRSYLPENRCTDRTLPPVPRSAVPYSKNRCTGRTVPRLFPIINSKFAHSLLPSNCCYTQGVGCDSKGHHAANSVEGTRGTT
ncbi:MAG: hypothetical protein F6K50_04245 [Moorea sp. SIO3I7]|uniref:hypothetical protein n=1 Tax=unclassified Moorena TaxID=2683338 RepID=UPI0013BE2A68|nr:MULTISPECIES: hypothetical protein [unclassified Moorena]NEN94763.1 hypothetical protein [Moorena sp. SIO3I7]NEO43503.1 hypothetical protein [Moorena sp. SIO4A3]NEQ81794.1 hypothetical protein [Moorena sp. SIO2I5]NEO08593.1 hypothetical protein [Moorena sp. SIO3I8]NEO21177.1 hypothetical protein [Moorena sp. SIO4A5]